MVRRLILKGIVVLAFVVIGIVAVAVIGVVGYFFLALAFPRRMSVTGRVTDIKGKPIRRVEVRAVPLPVYTPHLDHSMEAKDKEHIAVTDENGRYLFKRLVASGGVKEGMWVQEYDIVANAEGYAPQKIRVWNDFETHEDIITLTDFVLEEDTPDDKVDSKLFDFPGDSSRTMKRPAAAEGKLELVQSSEGGTGFVCAKSGAKFVAWGFNYDHDNSGRLLEDYWHQEWPTVAEDFREMKALGANVVRIHLQVAKFMKGPEQPNGAALKQLARLVRLAEETGLYLDITGLGCYHKKDVPKWYDAMDEGDRWDVQALFWEAVAKRCAKSDAVFCYDLMNEPILPGANKKETNWLAGEFAGKHFVQRITLDLAGRTRKQVAKAWIDKLAAAIRKHDERHMITVGVIPWVHTFPKARPLFYSEDVAQNLDFVSVHFYPKRGEVDKALAALSAYDIGKPLIVEEMFPLHCSMEELGVFIDASNKIADGWIGFYWGKTIDEYTAGDTDLAGVLTVSWLKYFRAKTPETLGF
ncbi:MAG TPA: cellulase family glycosylhydrolase [Sedimentisphaerales bacterium]|nr:cellulase family glycosylhydrolase [Sedimentisphaerales bacterium]